MASLTIIPLIAFNVKKFTIKKEGENPKPNMAMILLVLSGSIFLGVFLFTLYRFTLGYQTQLVLERFIKSYTYAATGKIDYDDFLKQTDKICANEFISIEGGCFKEIEEDRKLKAKEIKFQLGENILPKYYVEQDFFPDIENVKKDDTRPIFMLCMIDYDETRKFYVSLMDIDENQWYIQRFYEAPEDLVDYAYRYKLIRSEHSNKWYKLK